MKANQYIITKLKKDRSIRRILSLDKQTWLPISSKEAKLFADNKTADELIRVLGTDDNYWYLKTNV